MLRIALKPRWIAALFLALAISTVFVMLSQWQFSRSTQTVNQPQMTTETPRPLTEVLVPGLPVTHATADQVVTASGRFDPSRQVLVAGRILEGVRGYWVTTAFIVDGAPAQNGVAATPETVIPVARGWVADSGQAAAPPSGPIQLTGRLIAAEAPILQRDLPTGQVSALSTAELVNLWQVSSYRGFIVSFQELGADGDLGAHATVGPLKAISVGPQPVERKFNWLNIFYAIEWVVFAGFAVFLWWRLVADDHRRELEALEDEHVARLATAQRPVGRNTPVDNEPRSDQ